MTDADPARRPPRRLLALVGLLLALLPLAAARAQAAPAGPPNGSLIVIGTGGLTWSDVSREATPGLWSFLRDGASAGMTIRSVFTNSCPVDGWLGLSSGGRAAAPPVGGRPGDDRGTSDPCPPLPTVADGVVRGWQAYVDAASARRFDSVVGLVGQEARDAGTCVTAIGPGAAVLAADRTGRVAGRALAFDESTLLTDLTSCPVVVVDVGSVRDPGDLAEGEQPPTGSVAEQVRDIDAKVSAIAAAAPNGANLLLASVSDAGRTERLRLVAAKGPDFGPGTLASTSTRQRDLVQVQDVTATVLDLAGLPAPAGLGGAVLTRDPADNNSEVLAEQRLDALVDLDLSTYHAHELVPPFFNRFLYAQAGIYLLVALLWKGKIGTDRTRRRLLSWTRGIAVAAASVPVSTFLANLLPWWRFPSPMVGVSLAVALFAGLLTLVALKGPWRERLFAPVVVVAGATLLTLGLDVVTGSRLQLASLMGLQPVAGGRYYGLGNVSFALFATSALLLATVAANHLVLRGHPRLGAVAAGLVGGAATVVDGAPFWGADGGGPPALLPAVVFLVLSIVGIRITWRRGLLLAGATAALFVLVAFLDWLRPAGSRSHLGRFFASLLDGGAWDIVVRKLEVNLSILFGNYRMTLLVPIALALVTYVLARPTSWGARSLQRSFDRAPVLRTGLLSVAVMLTLGFLLNDSGVAIPAVAATLAVPLLIATSVRILLEESRAGATTRAERRGRR